VSDQAYLNQVSQIPGVTVTDPARATATARDVCAGLQNGESPADAAAATENNTGMTPAQAAAGVNAAITAYRPQYLR
jgi:serine/threonine protein kinase, bacterial